MSDAADVAYRVRGPSALAGDRQRFLNLAMTLAATDWKVRFFGSALGYLWSLLRPLMLFGILYFVFAVVVDAGAGVEDYPVQLLLGIVLFFYFAEVTGSAVTSLVDREALIRKVGFPRMVIPASVTFVATLNFALNLVVLVVFLAATGVEPRWTWLLLPIPFALVAVLAVGVAMLLAALYVPFRDVRPIWEVVTQALFYATPILYPVQRLAEESELLAKIALLNPLATLVQQSRAMLVGGSTPSAVDVLDSAALLLVPLALLAGLTVLGFWTFNRLAPETADLL